LSADWADEMVGRSIRLKSDSMGYAQFWLYLTHGVFGFAALLKARSNSIRGVSGVLSVLESRDRANEARLREILASFNEAWMKYWDSYIRLQDQLYESLRAGREVSWLAASDERKMSEINQVQRELFQNMPRRLDYSPLGQITRDLNSAPSKIKDLEAALAKAEEGCKGLEGAIALMKEKVEVMKKAMNAADP
jgi:hypothetical protein